MVKRADDGQLIQRSHTDRAQFKPSIKQKESMTPKKVEITAELLADITSLLIRKGIIKESDLVKAAKSKFKTGLEKFHKKSRRASEAQKTKAKEKLKRAVSRRQSVVLSPTQSFGDLSVAIGSTPSSPKSPKAYVKAAESPQVQDLIDTAVTKSLDVFTGPLTDTIDTLRTLTLAGFQNPEDAYHMDQLLFSGHPTIKDDIEASLNKLEIPKNDAEARAKEALLEAESVVEELITQKNEAFEALVEHHAQKLEDIAYVGKPSGKGHDILMAYRDNVAKGISGFLYSGKGDVEKSVRSASPELQPDGDDYSRRVEEEYAHMQLSTISTYMDTDQVEYAEFKDELTTYLQMLNTEEIAEFLEMANRGIKNHTEAVIQARALQDQLAKGSEAFQENDAFFQQFFSNKRYIGNLGLVLEHCQRLSTVSSEDMSLQAKHYLERQSNGNGENISRSSKRSTCTHFDLDKDHFINEDSSMKTWGELPPKVKRSIQKFVKKEQPLLKRHEVNKAARKIYREIVDAKSTFSARTSDKMFRRLESDTWSIALNILWLDQALEQRAEIKFVERPESSIVALSRDQNFMAISSPEAKREITEAMLKEFAFITKYGEAPGESSIETVFDSLLQQVDPSGEDSDSESFDSSDYDDAPVLSDADRAAVTACQDTLRTMKADYMAKLDQLRAGNKAAQNELKAIKNSFEAFWNDTTRGSDLRVTGQEFARILSQGYVIVEYPSKTGSQMKYAAFPKDTLEMDQVESGKELTKQLKADAVKERQTKRIKRDAVKALRAKIAKRMQRLAKSKPPTESH